MAHQDMETLLNEALNMASHFLEKDDEFLPFCVAMAPDGEVSQAVADTGEEQPPYEEIIDFLISEFTKGAQDGKYKATALTADVRIALDDADETDAIRVTVEHVDDEPVACYLPYQKREGKYEFGELIVEQAERAVFPKT